MRMFPIQRQPNKTKWDNEKVMEYLPYMEIPWDMIKPHEAQALRNHCGQSLQRLSERGGLSRLEAIAILEDKDFDAFGKFPTETESDLKLRAMVDEWLKMEWNNNNK